MHNNPIERVKLMEQYMEDVTEALHTAPLSLKADTTLQSKVRALTAYLDSGQWLQDYERDERGELPADLKRGVLSQDALYNLLEEIEHPTYILTSMFPDGFPTEIAELFQQVITSRKKFAFVASEFEKIPEKTDSYFKLFLNMFEDVGIHFENAYVVDGRMTPTQVQKAVTEADVVWLSGGDTPTQFGYFQKYGLIPILQQHRGILIGMSAGSINLAKTALCTLTCKHNRLEIYEALGCVDISVEPHFNANAVTEELLELSKEYRIYGLCDNSVIICAGRNVKFYGEVYRLENGGVEQIN